MVGSTAVSRASADTVLPGSGGAISYSTVVSNSKPRKRIAANLGSQYEDSANSGVCDGHVVSSESESNFTSTVITTQPASLSSKVNESHGKGEFTKMY